MHENIRPLTLEALHAQARHAAEQGIPLEEACAHLAHDAALSGAFTKAYAQGALAEAEVTA